MTDTCPKCGHTHDPTRCKGHVDKDPKTRQPIPIRQCRNRPMRAQAVCDTHGGKADQNLAAAARRVAAAELERSVSARLAGVVAEPVTDPLAFSQERLGQLGATADALEAYVGSLTDSDGGRRVWGADLQAQVAAWTGLVREIRRWSTDLIRAGFEDRTVAVLEQQAELMGQVEDRILGGMLAGVLRALADVDGAVSVVERVWPRLQAEVVPAEWLAIEQGGK